jgi:hypothetical protein
VKSVGMTRVVATFDQGQLVSVVDVVDP